MIVCPCVMMLGCGGRRPGLLHGAMQGKRDHWWRSSSNYWACFSSCQCVDRENFFSSIFRGLSDLGASQVNLIFVFFDGASRWSLWASSLVLQRPSALEVEKRYLQKGNYRGLRLLMGQEPRSRSQPDVICNCPFLLPLNLISSWLNLLVPCP